MAEHPSAPPSAANPPQYSGVPISASVLLLATAAIALLWSHYKLLWFDELIELQTDGVGSIREVLRIQRHFPISLDPALFHVLAHLSTRVFGVTAFGMRLPALLGFLLAQISLFFFVRRIAGKGAATVALALPALSGMLLYAAEARPYGLLYGLYGVSLLAYQQATRTQTQRHRPLALLLLAVAVACAINVHWFGVLILAPLTVAELVRILERRKLDWPLLAAFAAGACGVLFALPFHAGVARYAQHYYAQDGTVSLHTLTLCYRVLFLSDLQLGGTVERTLMVTLLGTIVAAVALLVRNRSRRLIDLPAPELALLGSLCLLPWFGFAVARLATHTMAIRYVFAAGLGFAAIVACAVAPWVRSRNSQRGNAAVLLLALAAVGYFHIHRERLKSASLLQQMEFTGEVAGAMHSAPGGHIYMANVFPYAAYTWYTPDRQVRDKLTLLYSYNQELALRGRDTNALTADHMRHFTGFPIAQYEDLRSHGGRALFVVSPDRWWDWTPDALQQDHATTRVIGKAYGGTVVEATFPQTGGRLQR